MTSLCPNQTSTSTSQRPRFGLMGQGLAAALGAAFCVVACGGGGSGRVQPSADGGGGGEPSSVAGRSGGVGDAGASTVDCDERPTEYVTLNQAIWQTGFKVTLGTAVFTPATPSCSDGTLSVDADFENRSGQAVKFDARTLLASAGKDYELVFDASSLPVVPGDRKGHGTLAFTVDQDFKLEEATLLFGAANRNQATVPLGEKSPDEVVTLEPQTLPLKGKIVAGNVNLMFEGVLMSADAYWSYESLAEDEVALRIDFSTAYTGNRASGVTFSEDNLSLELPDGTSIAPLDAPLEAIKDPGTTMTGLWVRFIVPRPVAGKYKLSARGRWGGPNDLDPAQAEFPFELPRFPTFGKE